MVVLSNSTKFKEMQKGHRHYHTQHQNAAL